MSKDLGGVTEAVARAICIAWHDEDVTDEEILPGTPRWVSYLSEARAAIAAMQDAAPAGDGERYREALIEARGELLRQQRGGDPDREEHCSSIIKHIDRVLAPEAAASDRVKS